MNMSSTILAATLLAAGAVAPAGAAPISPLGLEKAGAPSVETVQYRRGARGAYRARGFGGVGLGLAAGAIIGGAIIGATQPYGYGGYGYGGYGYSGYGRSGYGYAPGYDQGYVAVSPYAAGGGSEVAYCQQRFQSYDPRSGTYLGFDGLRHPCP